MTRPMYGVASYTNGKPFVYEAGGGDYTKTEAERFVRRWNLAAARLAGRHPPSLDPKCYADVLRRIASGIAAVPGGAEILSRIFAAERAESLSPSLD